MLLDDPDAVPPVLLEPGSGLVAGAVLPGVAITPPVLGAPLGLLAVPLVVDRLSRVVLFDVPESPGPGVDVVAEPVDEGADPPLRIAALDPGGMISMELAISPPFEER